MRLLSYVLLDWQKARTPVSYCKNQGNSYDCYGMMSREGIYLVNP